MQALWLEEKGVALQLRTLPEPTLREGGAVVKVLAAPILSFMGKVLSGELAHYILPTPFVPGANGIGLVESVAEGVPGLEPGQLVFLDPLTATPTTTAASDRLLIGLTGIGPDSAGLQRRWRHGTFAQRTLWPAENLTVLEGFQASDAPALAGLSLAAVPYGGLLKGGMRPGRVLVVNGATGLFGSAAVLVGLAMGAGAVVATGRDERVLAKLSALDPRVKAVRLVGDAGEDARNISGQAGPADLVLDILGGSATAAWALGAIQALRPGGTAVLMGGVSGEVALGYLQVMLGELTVTGCFMYPREAPAELRRMARAGLLRLKAMEPLAFSLADHAEALVRAAACGGLTCPMFCPQLGL